MSLSLCDLKPVSRKVGVGRLWLADGFVDLR